MTNEEYMKQMVELCDAMVDSDQFSPLSDKTFYIPLREQAQNQSWKGLNINMVI